MKTCIACGRKLAASAFAPNLNQCRDCRRAYVRRWTKENADRVKAKKREYYERHREHTLDRMKKYYADNREEVRERNRDWQARNRAHVSSYKASYYLQNIDREKAQRRQAYAANREEAKARVKRWQQENRARRSEYSRRRRARLKVGSYGRPTEAALQAKAAMWGNRCWMCGGPFTEFDHVKPLSKGGAHVLANLRPACKPCNSSKRDAWPFLLTGESVAS